MKRTPMRRQSEKQKTKAREIGAPKLGTKCNWCGSYWGDRVWDHVVLRSLLPGENRDHRDNLVPSCVRCNQRRAEGWTPEWWRVPERVQRFVVQQKPGYAERYFADVKGEP